MECVEELDEEVEEQLVEDKDESENLTNFDHVPTNLDLFSLSPHCNLL